MWNKDLLTDKTKINYFYSDGSDFFHNPNHSGLCVKLVLLQYISFICVMSEHANAIMSKLNQSSKETNMNTAD